MWQPPVVIVWSGPSFTCQTMSCEGIESDWLRKESQPLDLPHVLEILEYVLHDLMIRKIVSIQHGSVEQ